MKAGRWLGALRPGSAAPDLSMDALMSHMEESSSDGVGTRPCMCSNASTTPDAESVNAANTRLKPCGCRLVVSREYGRDAFFESAVAELRAGGSV
jgi:hypothetical protein